MFQQIEAIHDLVDGAGLNRRHLSPRRDRCLKGEPEIPREIDPRILRDLGHERIDIGPSKRLGIDGREMRLGQESTDDPRRRARIDQIIDHEDFGTAIGLRDLRRDRLQNLKLALPVVGVITRNADGFDNAQIEFAGDDRRRDKSAAGDRDDRGKRPDLGESPGERAGIVGSVTLAGKVLTGWDIFSLPMLTPGALRYTDRHCSGACFCRASFTVTTPRDTFLDTSALNKGEVWLNGHALGRFWNVGPEKTLYVPAPWLKAGRNEVVVFDLEGKPGQKIEGLDHPVLHAAVLPPPAE